MFPTIKVLPGYHKRLVAGYPWLYANEIQQSQSTKKLTPGQCVTVEYQGQPLAVGYYNRHSLISFRVLSRLPKTPIDTRFLSQRLEAALEIRTRFFPTPYYRLIHAEADGLPGLIIDRFDSVFVVQINTQGMHQLKPLLIEALQNVFNPSTLYFKNDSSIRQLEDLPITEPEVIGQPLPYLTVIENDVAFRIDMTSSQKTGWFYDHRENRKMLASLAKDKTVLDYFCYSGGFSVQAAKQQATRVIGIDRSEIALENARYSANLNGVSDRCQFICRDVFEDMDARIAAKEQFQILILDPPAFVKSKKDLAAGLRGYEKLLTKACQLLTPQGLLFIASCSYHVKENDLNHCLNRALYKSQREGRIVQTLGAGFDHPKHPFLEESSYLKGFLVSLL